MKHSTIPNPWIAYHQSSARTFLRLFCFPYAGGSASIYRSWFEQLPPGVEICPIQLPGRENRWKEAPFTHLPELIKEMLLFLPPYLEIPFAFFGHSMGALISFELTRALRKQCYPTPLYLFVSAYQAPQIPRSDSFIHRLEQPSFVNALRELNGTPEEVLQNTEVLELMTPLLRADFALCETYKYTDDTCLDCSISAFGGLNDTKISKKDLLAWKDQTSRSFILRMLPGDHFFLRDSRTQLLKALSQDLLVLLDLLDPRAEHRDFS